MHTYIYICVYVCMYVEFAYKWHMQLFSGAFNPKLYEFLQSGPECISSMRLLSVWNPESYRDEEPTQQKPTQINSLGALGDY